MDAGLVEVVKFVFPALIAIGVAFFAHHVSMMRELEAKRREYRLNFLVETYRTICDTVHRGGLAGAPEGRELERAIADVQLFGSAELVYAVQKFADDMAANGEADTDSLVLLLRDELRSEMGTDPVQGNVKWLRFHDGRKPIEGAVEDEKTRTHRAQKRPVSQ